MSRGERGVISSSAGKEVAGAGKERGFQLAQMIADRGGERGERRMRMREMQPDDVFVRVCLCACGPYCISAWKKREATFAGSL